MPVPKRKSPQSATRKRVASAWTLRLSKLNNLSDTSF